MSPTRTAPTIRSPQLARIVAELDALHLDDGTDAFPPSNLEFTEVLDPARARPTSSPAAATARLNIRFNNLQRGADLVELVARSRRARRARRDGRGADLGRGLPHPAGRALRPRRRRDPRRDRDRARAVDQRRHVGRPLPDQAMPGGRFRPAQRDHAQGRRACRGRGYRSAGADLRADHREGRSA